ncbi:MAG: hypothetical protein ACOX6I_08735 [Syntrophomonadaceae bacterium]
MKIGFVILGLGLVLFCYAFFRFKQEQLNLRNIKSEDLVSYYLDLAYNLLPVPLWSALSGIALVIIGVVVILANILIMFT